MAASTFAVQNLLPSCSKKALVLQAPRNFGGGYLADLVVAGYGDDPRPLFAVWPGMNPIVRLEQQLVSMIGNLL